MVEMNVKDMVNQLGTLTEQIKALDIAVDIAKTVSDEKTIQISQKQCTGIIKSLEGFRDILADRAETTNIYF